MILGRIHHVAIISSDHDQARDFYVNRLGFSVIRDVYRAYRDDWKLDLQVGDGTELEIFAKKDPPERVTDPEAAGLRHLAFRVADIEETVKELAGEGIVCDPIQEDTLCGGRYTFFYDPDGLPLELHE